ncbi:hypothetical protein [Microbacterium sp.]|uniref:hypothetical protein n=1 Tax=Microbacterium sp. TaxID=51671 RepID=UPI0028A62E9B|nr:hypothetical protein [Microbacterium sp.]
MIDVTAAADTTRSRRRTWMTGGVLFVASALLGLGMVTVSGLPFSISQLLFHAGAVVFAIGLGRGGSVTGRRPLGTGAIIALAVWSLVVAPVAWMLVNSAAPTDVGDLSTAAMVGTADEVVSLVLAIIAAVRIGRIAMVPRPWNWAPLWALGAIVFAQLIPNLIAAAGSISDQTLLDALFAVISLISASAVAFLGVVALVLALRPAPGETVVFASQR